MAVEGYFRELIQKVRAGDETAAAELVRRYETTIRRVARIRLSDANMQRILDSLDVCQSVLASFFVRAALGQYEVNNPDELLKLLTAMCRKKVADHVRREGAACRDYRRIRSSFIHEDEAVAADLNPYDQIAEQDLVQEFRKRLTVEERQLADKRVLGSAWTSIAAELGSSPEALRKKLMRAIDRVAAELGLQGFNNE